MSELQSSDSSKLFPVKIVEQEGAEITTIWSTLTVSRLVTLQTSTITRWEASKPASALEVSAEASKTSDPFVAPPQVDEEFSEAVVVRRIVNDAPGGRLELGKLVAVAVAVTVTVTVVLGAAPGL